MITTKIIHHDAEYRRIMSRTLEPRPTIPPPLSLRDWIHTALFAVGWLTAMAIGYCIGEYLRG